MFHAFGSKRLLNRRALKFLQPRSLEISQDPPPASDHCNGPFFLVSGLSSAMKKVKSVKMILIIDPENLELLDRWSILLSIAKDSLPAMRI